MRQALGETRSVFAARHAVISPDSHEWVTLPAWRGALLAHLITPALSAQFSLFLVQTQDDMVAETPAAGIERFILIREGAFTLQIDGAEHGMKRDDYAFVPAGASHRLSATGPAKALVLERRYRPLDDHDAPAPTLSALGDLPATPMKGDGRLLLQKLLPETPGHDLEINVMDFAPGASLPYVETHFMEHGLVMLDGGGIYRLEDAWYPVAAEDAIWMAPFCPQWFGAIGRSNARYLIYKDWNRDPL